VAWPDNNAFLSLRNFYAGGALWDGVGLTGRQHCSTLFYNPTTDVHQRKLIYRLQ